MLTWTWALRRVAFDPRVWFVLSLVVLLVTRCEHNPLNPREPFS